jgi:hypothetical protein
MCERSKQCTRLRLGKGIPEGIHGVKSAGRGIHEVKLAASGKSHAVYWVAKPRLVRTLKFSFSAIAGNEFGCLRLWVDARPSL